MEIVAKGHMWHILTPNGKTVGFASTIVLAIAKADHYMRTKLWTNPPTSAAQT